VRGLADFGYGLKSQGHMEIIKDLSIGMGLISMSTERGFSYELHNFAAVWSQIWRENVKTKLSYALLFQFQV